MSSSVRRAGGPALALVLAACMAPVDDADLLVSARLQTQEVCVAYDDLRGRDEALHAALLEDPLHQRAMELCDGVGEQGSVGR